VQLSLCAIAQKKQLAEWFIWAILDWSVKARTERHCRTDGAQMTFQWFAIEPGNNIKGTHNCWPHMCIMCSFVNRTKPEWQNLCLAVLTNICVSGPKVSVPLI
jgi:hypothetical protein